MDNITLFCHYHINLIKVAEKVRYYVLPDPIQKVQKENPLTKNLHLCETGEILITGGSSWLIHEKQDNNLLIYCTHGGGELVLKHEKISIADGQYYLLPAGNNFQFHAGKQKQTRFLIAWFNGENIRYLINEFSVVRRIIPSIKNQVANREMLFEEIFNNLEKGFHDENSEYINFCFGHLLATFIYGHKTIAPEGDESGHVGKRAILYFEKHLHQKLTLDQIASEAGYSPTYFSTLFRRETGYAPLTYFSHLKIVKACEYLDQTMLKVKQISFQLGYSDPYYFTRDFKLKMGLSPRQYRNRISARLSNREQLPVTEKT